MGLDRRRLRAAVVATVGSLLLAACLLIPGKFTADLDVRRNGTFSFRYAGGITLLSLAMTGTKATFVPEACKDDDGETERACTSEELAKQKSDFEAQQVAKAKEDAQAAQLFFGGIDPNDPRAAEEIAERLRRQKGWKRVDYTGNGLFDVEFVMNGRLDRDFVFPTIERFPVANAFVQIVARQDGTVRIDAPGFVSSASGGAAASMMQGTFLKGADATSDAPAITPVDGTLTIRTDAPILANNTDEGPRKGLGGGQELAWTINARTAAAPMALIRLQP
ncbi:hypothetical protein [Novosphingobium sp. 9U]|uniref:hypothetical protein n=1 Tax=Novosphingobium sp. 9U TaxID=2653158 RepID=UPI001F164DBC|nr:hypothetical protein [Novosphingobium sp. 9U]